MVHQTNSRIYFIFLFVAAAILSLTVSPAHAQDTTAPIFSIHPTTGQFMAGAIDGDTPVGTVELFFNGDSLGTFLVPPLTHTYTTVLTIVDVSDGIHSFEVRGDFTYSWSETPAGPPTDAPPPPLNTDETEPPPSSQPMSPESEAAPVVPSESQNTPLVNNVPEIPVFEPTALEIWAQNVKRPLAIDTTVFQAYLAELMAGD